MRSTRISGPWKVRVLREGEIPGVTELYGTAVISNQEGNETIVEVGFSSGHVLFRYGHPRGLPSKVPVDGMGVARALAPQTEVLPFALKAAT